MEFEAVDEGKIAKILVPEGSDGVKVGTPIAILAGEGEDVSAAAPAPKAEAAPPPKVRKSRRSRPRRRPRAAAKLPLHRPRPQLPAPKADSGDRIKASPLARRLAEAQGIDLSTLKGSGPGGRIVRADLGTAGGGAMAAPAAPAAAPAGCSRSSRAHVDRSTFRTRRSSCRTCARRSRAA